MTAGYTVMAVEHRVPASRHKLSSATTENSSSSPVAVSLVLEMQSGENRAK